MLGELDFTLRIVAGNAMPGVGCAVQAGRPHEVVQEIEKSFAWDVPAQWEAGRVRGPFIQKDSRGPFVYVRWGAMCG